MKNKTFYIDTPLGKIPAILYTPDEKKSDVVVIFEHGRGETGNGDLTGGAGLPMVLNSTNHANLLAAADKYGFSVLAPRLVPKLTGWVTSWTPEYSNYCIDYALKNLTKLPKVGFTGLSQGGGGCWLAMTSPLTAGKIFACVSMCPTPEYSGDFSLIAKNNIPVWNFHAVNDTTVNISSSRNMIQAANKFNPEPDIKYEELPSGGHYIWQFVYARTEVYEWLLSYVPKETAPIVEDKVLYTIKTTIYSSGKIETIKI